MYNKIRFFVKRPSLFFVAIISRLPYFRFLRETGDYQCTITFGKWFSQKVLNKGGNKNVYWPVHPTSMVVNWQNIYAGIDTCPGLMPGCYIQGIGKVYVGDYTQLGPNVSIISANHDLYDTRRHIEKTVTIGKYSWLGAGAKIMPGVTLGDYTIVGAGAVVTKSFEDGYCVIGGNPAKLIKTLEKEKCTLFTNKNKYYGYLNEKQFASFRAKYLNV